MTARSTRQSTRK